MRMKVLSIIGAIIGTAFLALGAGTTPIENLKLIGNENGNGNSITNLATTTNLADAATVQYVNHFVSNFAGDANRLIQLDSNAWVTVMSNRLYLTIVGNTNTVVDTNPYGYNSIPIPLAYFSTNTANFMDGQYRKCIMTGDMALNGPTNAVYGSIWTCYLTASGGARNLTIPASVLVPSDSGFTSPKVLSSGLTYIVQYRYGLSTSGTNWLLNSVLGGY